MTKQQAIEIIEELFPIDSEFNVTNIVGRTLLMESIQESNWRDLPENILSIYAQKCIDEDRRQQKLMERY